MLRESFKWVMLGGLTATALSVGIFLQVPVSADLEEPRISAEDTDYSRSLYGVPVLEMNHYKLNSDDYFKYIMAGGLSVGRDNPSSFTGWYSLLINNPDMLSKDSELRDKVNEALGDAKFNELKDALAKAEEDRIIKEKEDKEKAEREKEEAERAELEDKTNEEESTTDEKTDVVDESDKTEDVEEKDDSFLDLNSVGYANTLIEEYNSFNNSVKVLDSKFNEKDWKNLKEKTDTFNVKFSNSLSKDASKLAEESSKQVVQNITEVNSLISSYTGAYDSKYSSGKDSGEIKVLKDKIENLIKSIKKELK